MTNVIYGLPTAQMVEFSRTSREMIHAVYRRIWDELEPATEMGTSRTDNPRVHWIVPESDGSGCHGYITPGEMRGLILAYFAAIDDEYLVTSAEVEEVYYRLAYLHFAKSRAKGWEMRLISKDREETTA